MTTTINYLTEYIPTRFSATSKQISDRQMVWRFKDGIYDNDVMGKFASVINQVAGSNSIVCFIPASSNSRTSQRFERLSDYISTHCSVRASVNYISRTDASLPGHIYGKSGNPAATFVVDSSVAGKDVILIDDVITRGTTFYATVQKLLMSGARSVRGLFLAKTVHPAS